MPSSGTSPEPLVRFLPVTGAVYVLAWVLGLLLGPSAPAPTAPAADIRAFYVDHAGGVVLLSLLVHGVAGIALALLPSAAPGRCPPRPRQTGGSGSPGRPPRPSPSSRSRWR